jgi:hypothetical protein
VYRADGLDTITLIREFSLRDADGDRVNARAIMASQSGQIFVGDYEGFIREYTPNGILVRSRATGMDGVSDVDIHPDGGLIIGGEHGEFVITDTTFVKMQRVGLSGYNTYVTFAINVPESAGSAPIAFSIAFALFRRRLFPNTELNTAIH